MALAMPRRIPARRRSVAVLLAGVSASLCPLALRAAPPPREVVLFVVDDFSTPAAHGTQVRTILERASARRVPIRSIDVGETLDRARYFEGIQSIQAFARAHPGAAAVVNLSFGSYVQDERERALLEELAGEGALVVAAAGNDGTDLVFYPAGYEGVLAVGALDEHRRIAGYSNSGRHIAFYAPGRFREELVSQRLEIRGGGLEVHTVNRFLGGTSFAAPRVAGLAAYLLRQRPELAPARIRELFLGYSVAIPVRFGRPPVHALDAPAVLAGEDPFTRRAATARGRTYLAVGLLLAASAVYGGGAGIALLIGAAMWAGLAWLAYRPIVGRLGEVHGGLAVHAAAALGIAALSLWNIAATRRERRREREARALAAQLARLNRPDLS